ncbi:hypothetical protein K7I13_08710 [Brucepastera parasyntrophica]|uniref:hypothetical protein n=1 Tax=Brucepastera parasyntrophica TaxID=2880008 RepID=UPI00210D76FE|nr:hypothetical protein [Brucepastera parasyntrophica]ULQ58641.1 hypothetical protein K7I13_08710 [Brucepastera parasyntrophica]
MSGKLLSEELSGTDGSYSYKEFNEYGDVVFHKYEHEKSNGLKTEIYNIEYDNNRNKVRIETFDKGILIHERINIFNDRNLLTESLIINHENNIERKHLYEYNENEKLLEEKYLNSDGIETFAYYFEYDEEGRITKKGERTSTYNRYWTYEYY